VVGSKGAIELPHDAFVPWDKEAYFTLRGAQDEQGQVVSLPAADEYQLMVEHFAQAVLGRVQLAYSPQESVCQMQVLDALADAARNGVQIIL
jgi:hypothetical protein